MPKSKIQKNKRHTRKTHKSRHYKMSTGGSGESTKSSREFNGYTAITEELMKYNPFATEYMDILFQDKLTGFNKLFNGFKFTGGYPGTNMQLSSDQNANLLNELNNFKNDIITYLRDKDSQGIIGYSNFKLIKSMTPLQSGSLSI
jgi:hypothetical protein